ncbi:GNAT family N-acetyltransferase [Butyricimonas hominis]|uniref:GNAT family N-acetyltransferase n=1 Tax=Butyricimonas TaxID=574697 RepID=UPI0035175436
MLRYRVLEVKDVKEIARVHLVAFQDFFLSSLGSFFLQTYYKAVIRHPRAVCIGSYDQERLVGFCVGSVISKGFHKDLLRKNFINFFGCFCILVLTRPKSVLRLINNLEKKSKLLSIPDDGQQAELLSIAVLPSVASKGVGSCLLHSFEDNLLLNQVREVVLTTDVQNNDAVIHFYKKNGFDIYYQFVAYPHREMYKMIKRFFN